jgi:hypothetical protein
MLQSKKKEEKKRIFLFEGAGSVFYSAGNIFTRKQTAIYHFATQNAFSYVEILYTYTYFLNMETSCVESRIPDQFTGFKRPINHIPLTKEAGEEAGTCCQIEEVVYSEFLQMRNTNSVVQQEREANQLR